MNFPSEGLPQPQANDEFPACAVSLALEHGHQTALSNVIEKIRACENLSDLFRTTALEVRQLLRADRVGIFQFVPDSGWNEGEFVAEDVKPGISSVLAEKVHDHCFGEQFAVHYAQGRIQALPDIHRAQLSDCHVKILSRFQVRANLIVPLRLISNELWGLLCIHQCDGPRQWRPSDIEFVKQIGDYLGVALQQFLYLRQVKTQATQLAQMKAQAQAMERQQSLVKIANKIRRSLDFATICQTATQEVRHLLKADRIAIYQFNPDWSGNFVHESVVAGWDPLVEVVSPLEDTYLMETQGGRYANNEPLAVTDIYQEGYQACHLELLEKFQARAYAIAPIFQNDQLWGLFAAYQNTGPRAWKADEVQLLAQIGEQLGIALQQANHVQQIRTQSDELEKALEELKQSQAKLIQQEKMAGLGQLVAGVAHEINNPVNFIYGNLNHVEGYVQDVLAIINLYQQQYPEPADKIRQKSEILDLDFILVDLPKILDSMKIGADRIRKIVLSLRNFARLDEAEFKAVDIHDGIDSTLLVLSQRLKTCCQSRGINVVKHYGQVPLVQCYPAQLNQVLMNLLVNAIDAVEAGFESHGVLADHHLQQVHDDEYTPRIQITTGVTDKNRVEIRIRDNGIGINAAQQAKVFDYFFTTKPVGSGTGLGLAIARDIIVGHHHGSLRLASTPGQGAEFIIRLPLSSTRLSPDSLVPDDLA